MSENKPAQTVDVRNMGCPMPVVQTKKAMNTVGAGEVVEVLATDKGAMSDLRAWASSAGHEVLSAEEESGGTLRFQIRKKH